MDCWREIEPPIDVGFQFNYFACRYCDAKVTNEFGPWKQNHTRDKTPRDKWVAIHESWCIVPEKYNG